MARPREFDIDDTLREAGERFWAKGYQATSIQDIAAATGVKPGSLYKTFGDKKSLFLKCVDHYMSSLSYKQMLEENFQKPLRECFETLFDAVVESVAESPRHSGCLVTNTALELATVDPAIAAELNQRLGEMERLVRYRLTWAQENGELAADRDLESLAAYLFTVLQGLLLSSRVTKDREAMRRAIGVALDVLEAKSPH